MIFAQLLYFILKKLIITENKYPIFPGAKQQISGFIFDNGVNFFAFKALCCIESCKSTVNKPVHVIDIKTDPDIALHVFIDKADAIGDYPVFCRKCLKLTGLIFIPG